MEEDAVDSEKVHNNQVGHMRLTRRMLQESVSSQAVMNQAKSWNVPNQFKTIHCLRQRSQTNSDLLEVSLSDDSMNKMCSSPTELSNTIIDSTGSFVESENKNVVGNNILDDQITEEFSNNRNQPMELLSNTLIKLKECQDDNVDLVSTKESTFSDEVSKAPAIDEEKVTLKEQNNINNITTFMSTDIRFRKKDPDRNISKDRCLNSELSIDQDSVDRLLHRKSPNVSVPCKKENPVKKKKKKKSKQKKHLTHDELEEVLERQEAILHIETDRRRRAATNLESELQDQMENVNIVKELFLRDFLGKLNLTRQKEIDQHKSIQLNLSQLLSLEFKSESEGYSILRCFGEFIRSSPGNVKVDKSSNGTILFKFRTKRCLEELMMKQCSGDSMFLENISKLDERLAICPDSMNNDWVVRVITQHHSIHQLRLDLKGHRVKSIQALHNTDVWNVKFAHLVDCFEMILNDRFKKDVVFIKSVHQQLIEHRLIKLTNQGRACLTEQQLLSLVWRGENEESSTSVTDQELFRTCFTIFLSTCLLETVEEDENGKLLLVYRNKETLEIDLIHHCRADWRNLILNKSQRVKLSWTKKLGLAFQSGKELDPTLFSNQIGPWRQQFGHYVLNRRALLKILRNPLLREITQNLIVSINSFIFKAKVKKVAKKELFSVKMFKVNNSFNSFQFWQMPINEVMLEKIGVLELIEVTKEVKQNISEVEQNNLKVGKNIKEIVPTTVDDDQKFVQVKENNDKYNSVVYWKTPLVEIKNSNVKTTKALIIDVISESEVSE